MAYYSNPNHFSFYHTAEESQVTYPPLNQPPAIYPHHGQAYNIPAERWGMIPQQGTSSGPPTSLPGEVGFESVVGATPHISGPGNYDQLPWTEYSWPAVCQQSRAGQASSSNLDAPYARDPTASTFTPTPSSVPFHNWGGDQNGPSTSTFNWNAHTSDQSSSGPARTERISVRRFQPYGTPGVRENEYRYVEAGPPTTVPPQVPHVGLQTAQPTGGTIPETTADAGTTQTVTEEKEIPVPKRTRLPKGQGKPRESRKMAQGDGRELCGLVKIWKGYKRTPSLRQTLSDVAEYIPTVRMAVYQNPRLATGGTKPLPESSKRAKKERERRNDERAQLKELSRYYRLEGDSGNEVWETPPLLREVLQDMKVHHPPPGLANVPAP